MTNEDVRPIAHTYFESWRSRDFDRLRTVLADDVTFRGVLGSADGVDGCIAGLQGMAQNIMTDIKIQVMAVDGPDVMTWFDLHNKIADPIPTVNWSHVENGHITRIRVTFDPRSLLPPEGQQTHS